METLPEITVLINIWWKALTLRCYICVAYTKKVIAYAGRSVTFESSDYPTSSESGGGGGVSGIDERLYQLSTFRVDCPRNHPHPYP